MTGAALTCDLCHEQPPIATRGHLNLCGDCSGQHDEWESLTPAEKDAERAAMARHTAEDPWEML